MSHGNPVRIAARDYEVEERMTLDVTVHVDGLKIADIVCGLLACALLWGRRRWPLGVALMVVPLTMAVSPDIVQANLGAFGSLASGR